MQPQNIQISQQAAAKAACPRSSVLHLNGMCGISAWKLVDLLSGQMAQHFWQSFDHGKLWNCTLSPGKCIKRCTVVPKLRSVSLLQELGPSAPESSLKISLC